MDYDIRFPSGQRLVINDEGFALWDMEFGRWMIDASTLTRDNRMRIAAPIAKSLKKSNPRNNECHPWLIAKYPKSKRSRKGTKL